MTPERVKEASRAKRRRTCAVCGDSFMVKKADHVGKTCSKPCLSRLQSNLKTGKKQSPELIAKRMAGTRATYAADPEREARWKKRLEEGKQAWCSIPENAARMAKLLSERMKALHTDPKFQERRNARSSRTMKANWVKYRGLFTAAAVNRYARMAEEGQGLCSPESIAKRKVAAKWILKQAQAALHAETDYDAIFADAQDKLRREHPYDGPQNGSDYMDYCSKIGTLTANDPECRRTADTFMAIAIPRFADEWRALAELEKMR